MCNFFLSLFHVWPYLLILPTLIGLYRIRYIIKSHQGSQTGPIIEHKNMSGIMISSWLKGFIGGCFVTGLLIVVVYAILPIKTVAKIEMLVNPNNPAIEIVNPELPQNFDYNVEKLKKLDPDYDYKYNMDDALALANTIKNDMIKRGFQFSNGHGPVKDPLKFYQTLKSDINSGRLRREDTGSVEQWELFRVVMIGSKAARLNWKK